MSLRMVGKEVARNSMDPTTPVTFPEDETFDIGQETAMDPRGAILAELGLSERIVRGGYEVVPRFSIHAPDGPHSVMIQLSHDLAEFLY